MTTENRRHGCLTTWLVLMIIGSAGVVLPYLRGSERLHAFFPNAPAWAFPVMGVLALFNVACVIALFQWKKWGFWGVCVGSVVALVVNQVIGVGLGAVLGAILGPIFLYAVLQIGKEDKGWPQLK